MEVYQVLRGLQTSKAVPTPESPKHARKEREAGLSFGSSFSSVISAAASLFIEDNRVENIEVKLRSDRSFSRQVSLTVMTVFSGFEEGFAGRKFQPRQAVRLEIST